MLKIKDSVSAIPEISQEEACLGKRCLVPPLPLSYAQDPSSLCVVCSEAQGQTAHP